MGATDGGSCESHAAPEPKLPVARSPAWPSVLRPNRYFACDHRRGHPGCQPYVVADADVGEGPEQRAASCTDGQAQQRYEEHQPEQQSPEPAAERARRFCVVVGRGSWVSLARFSAHHRGVLYLDELLGLQRPQLLQRHVGPAVRAELPRGQCRHDPFLSYPVLAPCPPWALEFIRPDELRSARACAARSRLDDVERGVARLEHAEGLP